MSKSPPTAVLNVFENCASDGVSMMDTVAEGCLLPIPKNSKLRTKLVRCRTPSSSRSRIGVDLIESGTRRHLVPHKSLFDAVEQRLPDDVRDTDIVEDLTVTRWPIVARYRGQSPLKVGPCLAEHLLQPERRSG